MSVVIAAFYKFVPLPDYRDMRSPLLELCRQRGLRGTTLLAAEGINGTLSGDRAGIDALAAWLRADGRFDGIEYKESFAADHPFGRLKVRLKKEIVTMGMPQPDAGRVSGVHVGPAEWNALLRDPEVTVIDVRNYYEYEVGMFDNAVLPQTGSFREFPEYVAANLDPGSHKKIAMYCTGGIRCEKASAWMLQQGFNEVYQLNGGILRYLAEADSESSLWRGECFVFDERGAVDGELQARQVKGL